MSPSPEGILNMDKPTGITSHDVVNRVRRVAGLRRVGHAGTLDPLATGVLLLCLGRATRLVEYMMGQPKTYEVVIRLGQNTDTYDAEGEVVAERPCHITPYDLTTALAQFRGPIQQTPPLYSAIKKDGQPLYKLARQGKEVEIEARAVTIYQLEQLAFNLPLLTLRVVCSSGTYIRSLAHDLGEALGCGGHVAALRRTAVGHFTLDTAVPLGTLTPENLATHTLPLDTTVSHLPAVNFSEIEATRLWQGQFVRHQPHQSLANLARAYTSDGQFMGIVILSATNEWQPHKMFHPA
ncbi:MAG: tRNA pseudouridine(55) synthase TruB [Chloroflexi bacterium]|nr:tRNA pseudouridine(55) synthase TruB [Ardenticatenaceae bacterium]MBL1130011.1 tRNA pseudouridine(55) synthase TruB [Chloroflexota bacterium]NOG36097.1 tRNA pseudouridine(55) synthase TruB [Chloroflexota bacterium]GIK58303.1 MAG: tRNA pseudouridine synthase B [Chloroflexota bacterium]